MFLLTNNILSHKTCLKPKGGILDKGAKTHGSPTLVDFHTYVELNKDTIVESPCESVAYKVTRVK
jgi:hypothetical protein